MESVPYFLVCKSVLTSAISPRHRYILANGPCSQDGMPPQQHACLSVWSMHSLMPHLCMTWTRYVHMYVPGPSTYMRAYLLRCLHMYALGPKYVHRYVSRHPNTYICTYLGLKYVHMYVFWLDLNTYTCTYLAA